MGLPFSSNLSGFILLGFIDEINESDELEGSFIG
jgi:hypothetical protein